MKKSIYWTLGALSLASVFAYQNCTKGFMAKSLDSSALMSESPGEPSFGPNDLVVFDSSIAQPAATLKLFNSTGVQFSLDQIEDANILVTNKGAACDFPDLKLKGSREWPLHCWWSLQIFNAARKGFRLFQAIDPEYPSRIEITTQDPDARCYATGGGSTIAFCSFPEDRMLAQFKHIAAITYHEMAHIAQGPRMASFVTARLGGLQEDHATLFSYLLTGQTEFVDSHEGPEMVVHDPQSLFGWKSYGNYGSHLALTSFLIDSHRLLLSRLDKAQIDGVTVRLAQIFLNLFDQASLDHDAQDLLKIYMSSYEKLIDETIPAAKSQVLSDATALLKSRNMDLSSSAQSGYLLALISQELPANIGGTWRSQNLTATARRAPAIKLSQTQVSPQAQLLLPIQVYLVPKNYLELIEPCLNSLDPVKASELGTKGVVRECSRQMAGTSLTLTTGTIQTTSFEFKNPGDVFDLHFSPGISCSGTDHVFAKAFDSKSNEILTFLVMTGCQ